jgi:hypothetical protein
MTLLYGIVISGRGGAADVADPDQPGPDEPGRARPGRHRAGPIAGALFTRAVLDYAAHQPGRAVSVLQAGCATAGRDLDIPAVRASRVVLTLTQVDDDNELTRAAVTGRPELAGAVLAELRTVPLVPRSLDIVHCCLLLDRISHAEIVLGRLVDALRPGGLLLLRTADRQTAAGFLDRRLPGPLRALAWRSLRPGEPGPYPAVYEPLTCARGLQAFVSRHGLVIASRETTSRVGAPPATGTADPATADPTTGDGRAARRDASRRRPVIRASRSLVALASRGRLPGGHDELRYVIRKPQDRFARLL